MSLTLLKRAQFCLPNVSTLSYCTYFSQFRVDLPKYPQCVMPTITKKTPKLAIDVGGVLSCTDTDSSAIRCSVAEHLESKHPTVECAEACRFLASEIFGPENTYILSKCKSRVQKATVKFLNNPMESLDNQSFLEYTGIPARNVLFCFQRSGGNAPVRLVPLQERDGPRVADDNTVGKGAIAATLGLTHMIDDREDCLLSLFWEGVAQNSCSKGLSKGRKQTPPPKRLKKKGKQNSKLHGPEDNDDSSILGIMGLFHFGDHAATTKPSMDRVISFAESRCGCSTIDDTKVIESIAATCIKHWLPVSNWDQVVQRFRRRSSKNEESSEVGC